MKSVPNVVVIDIGNTSTSLGLFRAGRVSRVTRIDKVRQTKQSIRTILRQAAGRARTSGVCVASVVPSLNTAWRDAIRAEFDLEPLWVSHRLDLGIGIRYPKPATIGADRLANAAGAAAKYGTPAIIGDFGTAVTFDVVTRRDGYIGGVIAPGPALMFDYLAERTAKLPRVTWRPTRARVGRSTEEAMLLGAQWGYRGLFKEILRELIFDRRLRNAKVIATGGFASRLLKGLEPQPVIDPELTLFGVGCIYMLNAGAK